MPLASASPLKAGVIRVFAPVWTAEARELPAAIVPPPAAACHHVGEAGASSANVYGPAMSVPDPKPVVPGLPVRVRRSCATLHRSAP